MTIDERRPIPTQRRVTLPAAPRLPPDEEIDGSTTPPPVKPLIQDATEAERRFYVRYGWQLVERLLGDTGPATPTKPTTIDEWISVAERVRDVLALSTGPGLTAIATRLEAAVARLEAAPARTGGSASKVEPFYNGDGQACCPTHKRVLKEGRYSLYCSAKDDSPAGKNGYCAYSWKEG